MRMLSETEAVEAVNKTDPDGISGLRATRQDGQLWSVAVFDSSGMVEPGGGWLVGPDGKAFSISSNPGIHDRDLAARLLNRMYEDGIAHAVEPAVFASRLQEVTHQRETLADEVLREARAGALRTKPPRRLIFRE